VFGEFGLTSAGLVGRTARSGGYTDVTARQPSAPRTSHEGGRNVAVSVLGAQSQNGCLGVEKSPTLFERNPVRRRDAFFRGQEPEFAQGFQGL
jgi:hypothetical protein